MFEVVIDVWRVWGYYINFIGLQSVFGNRIVDGSYDDGFEFGLEDLLMLFGFFNLEVDLFVEEMLKG